MTQTLITLRMYCPFLPIYLHIPPHSSRSPSYGTTFIINCHAIARRDGARKLVPSGIWTWQLAPDDCFALLISLPQDSLFSCYLYAGALWCFPSTPSQPSSKWSTAQEDQGLTLELLILGPHESHHTTITTRFLARLHRLVPHLAWLVARTCPLPQQV